MRIRRVYVDNFKNLVNCEIRPQLIHAVTGCNGSGKSNLLQVFPFVSKIISGTDTERGAIFHGWVELGGGRWLPAHAQTNKGSKFKFELECEVKVDEVIWIVEYKLAFTPFEFSKKEPSLSALTPDAMKIENETLLAKELGKPGKSKTLIDRDAEGKTGVYYTSDTRASLGFSTQDKLSVLKTLEIREPKSFATDFPVIVAFREALLATDLIRLNASKLIDFSDPTSSTPFSRSPGDIVEHFAPYHLLKSIEKDTQKWSDFQHWMKILCCVDDISLYHYVLPKGAELSDQKKESSGLNFIFLRQHGRTIHPNELSTGHAMILGILTALFTFLRHNGPVFLEEPESYLHPKAVVDLLKALRLLSTETTVMISTHSPVLLNDMKPEEVSVMIPAKGDDGYFTTENVAEIEEATAILKRGYLSFGDLLQTNFTIDEKNN